MLCPNCKKDYLIPHPTNPRVCGCPTCLTPFPISVMEQDDDTRETKPVIRFQAMGKTIKFFEERES